MPSETVLKVLIALNSVQLFLTLLLVSILASAGLSQRGAQASAQAWSDPPAASWDDGGGDSRGSSGPGRAPPSDGAAAQPPPASDGGPSGDALAVADGAPTEAAPVPSGADRTRMLLRTYLNLVTRRLQMAATDAQVDVAPFLPTDAEIDAAAASADIQSDAFVRAVDKLRPGYERLHLTLPAPPGSARTEQP